VKGGQEMTEQEMKCLICGDPVSDEQKRKINNKILHFACVHVSSEKHGIRGGKLIGMVTNSIAIVRDENDKTHNIDISDLESDWVKE